MKTHGQLRYAPPRWENSRGAWLLKATPDVMIRIKRLFPRAESYIHGQILLYDTPEVARDIEWLVSRWPLETDVATAERLRERANEHRAKEEAVMQILTGARPHLAFQEPARPARDYQLVAADLALTTGQLLLCDDLGLGKSMAGLLVLRNPDALPALIVCPTHLPHQWQRELELTLPSLRSHIVRSGQVYEPSRRREMNGHTPDVLIINYSKLHGWAYHLAGEVRTVIFDEAQELRRAESQKYQAARYVAGDADFRIGLTATPIYNYGGEIHNVLSVLAPDAVGSREEFGREWCHGRWSDKVTVADPAALGVYLREQGLMLRRTRKDVGRELPEVVRVPHSIESDGDVFEDLAQNAVDLAELIVSRTAAREELWRASGEFDWRMRHATGVAKAPYVGDFVKLLLEADERLVLFGWHHDVYATWAKKLKEFEPVFFTGSESPAQKRRARDAFMGGDSRILVMSLRAGLGLDGLQEVAHIAVFGELDWSPGMHDQCIGRLHRDGMGDDPVVAYFLVSDHGADPKMAEVLNLKRQQSEPLRDPDAPLFTAKADVRDRVRQLALEVLAKRRVAQGEAA